MNDLIVNSIFKSFGATTVLENISLTFSPGTVTAIVGDNGAGKSTLCKTIAGVYKPNQGSIMLGDMKLDGLNPHQTRAAGIEMIYQDLALAKQHDVISNLFFGREQTYKYLGWLNKKAMREQAAAVLNEIGIIIKNLDIPVGFLSGGQQQAIAIARALLFSPKVLIMDEPTAALAVREIEHILDLIKQLKDKGLTIILISHRLNDIFQVSDRIITLGSGRIVAENLTKEVSMPQVVGQIMGV